MRILSGAGAGGSTWRARKLSGFGVKEATSAPHLGPGQQTSWYAGTVGSPAPWLAVATGRPAVTVRGSVIDVLARSHPTDAVLVGDVRCQGGRDVRTYEFRPAASLADRPPVIHSCWPEDPPQPPAESGR